MLNENDQNAMPALPKTDNYGDTMDDIYEKLKAIRRRAHHPFERPELMSQIYRVTKADGKVIIEGSGGFREEFPDDIFVFISEKDDDGKPSDVSKQFRDMTIKQVFEYIFWL